MLSNVYVYVGFSNQLFWFLIKDPPTDLAINNIGVYESSKG